MKKLLLFLLLPFMALAFVPSNERIVEADQIKVLESDYVTIKNPMDLDSNALFGISDLTVTGITKLNTSLTGPLKAVAGVVASGDILLGFDTSGILPVIQGGTNSSTVLTNDKVMVSTTDSIIESATTTTQLGFLDATSSIQTQLDEKAQDDEVVHLLGDETISGVKTFNGQYVAVSTINGMRPCPVMSELQRDNIASPSEGDCVVNSTENELNFYLDGEWGSVGGGSGSGSGGINYLVGDNSTFDKGLGDWLGDGTLAIFQEVTNPLRGLGSLKIVKDSDVSDKAVSVNFTVDIADLGKTIPLTFDYDFSDVDYEDGHAIVKVIQDPDGTPVELELSSNNELKNGKFPFLNSFDADGTIRDYQLQIYWVDSGATDVIALIDNVIVGPERIDPKAYLVELSNVSNWSTPEAVTDNWGNFTVQARYLQVGPNAIIEWSGLANGAVPTGVELNLGMPSGLTIDTSNMLNRHIGSGLANPEGVNLKLTGVVFSGADSYVVPRILTTDMTDPETSTSKGGLKVSTLSSSGIYTGGQVRTFQNGNVVRLTMTLPIVGWTATTDAVVKKSKLLKVRADTLSGGTSTTSFAFNYVNSINELEDDYNALTDTGDIVFTVPEDKAGYYTFDFGARVDYGGIISAVECGLTVVSSTSSSKSNTFANNTTQSYNKCFFKDMKLEVGDTVKFFVRKSGTDSVTWSTDTRWGYLTISEQPSTSINVVDLDSTKTECQTKRLTSSLSSGGVIAELGFSNLTIGKNYSITTQARCAAGNVNCKIRARQGSLWIAETGTQPTSAGTEDRFRLTFHMPQFTATTTTVVQEVSATSTFLLEALSGNNEGLGTFSTLCELPTTHVSTTKF